MDAQTRPQWKALKGHKIEEGVCARAQVGIICGNAELYIYSSSR